MQQNLHYAGTLYFLLIDLSQVCIVDVSTTKQLTCSPSLFDCVYTSLSVRPSDNVELCHSKFAVTFKHRWRSGGFYGSLNSVDFWLETTIEQFLNEDEPTFMVGVTLSDT